MTGREIVGAYSREFFLEHNISVAERKFIKELLGCFKDNRESHLDGVNVAVLLVGSHAEHGWDVSKKHADIDLRVVFDARPELQKKVVKSAEEMIIMRFAKLNPVFKSRIDWENGHSWHIVKDSPEDEDCRLDANTPRVISEPPDDDIKIIFPSDSQTRNRIEVTLTKPGGFNIEQHLEWEKTNEMQHIVIADTRLYK